MTIVNHIGLAVTDIARSRRFYEAVLGFQFTNDLAVPDGASSKLLDVERPVNMTAAYLQLDGWVLELLCFDRDGNAARRDRSITEPGLTHISICVDDIDATAAKAVEFGGESLPGQGFPGMVAMIRDPDGQLIELLPMTYRDSF